MQAPLYVPVIFIKITILRVVILDKLEHISSEGHWTSFLGRRESCELSQARSIGELLGVELTTGGGGKQVGRFAEYLSTGLFRGGRRDVVSLSPGQGGSSGRSGRNKDFFIAFVFSQVNAMSFV